MQCFMDAAQAGVTSLSHRPRESTVAPAAPLPQPLPVESSPPVPHVPEAPLPLLLEDP
jgi:hypothetical protein